MSTREGLRELATRATPGPWVAEVLGSEGYDVRTTEARVPIGAIKRRQRIARFGYESWEMDRANAEFVADANPQRVLALLDDLVDLEAKARALLDAMMRFGPGDSGQLWDAAQALRALVGDETPRNEATP